MRIVFHPKYTEVYASDPAATRGRLDHAIKELGPLYGFVTPGPATEEDIAWGAKKCAQLRIFNDDDITSVNGVLTLARMWGGKWHEYVGNGTENVRALPVLAEWRSAVGDFPHNLNEFRRAWDKHGDTNNPAVYQYAWGLTSQIREGQWLDHDSKLTMTKAEKDQIREKYRTWKHLP